MAVSTRALVGSPPLVSVMSDPPSVWPGPLVSALDDEFADETHGFRFNAKRAIDQGRHCPVGMLWLPAVTPGRPGPRGGGRSGRDARGTVRARKSRISAAISAALSSSAKWPVWSAW